MKKLYIVLCLSLLTSRNYGQAYHPFPTVNGIWTYELLDDLWNSTGILTTIRLSGDTTIGAYTYKKLYGANQNVSGIRENNKMIYYYNPDSLAEYLLYNFNLQLGDTFFHPYDECSSPIPDAAIVTMLDSIILADNSYHKRWWFGANGCGWCIEGVGSPVFLVGPNYGCSVSGGWRLNCFKNDISMIYFPQPWTSCITGINDIDDNVGELKIYPNPSNNSIHVEKNFTVEKKSSYRIIDASGKIIEDNKGIPNEISIKNLMKGNYFITFENNGKRDTRKFIKY